MKKRYYRWRWRWSEIQMYIRGWYRRIRYHWFTNKKLVAVSTLKRSQYCDMVYLIPETVFQLFRNFVENELGGIKGVGQSILSLNSDVQELRQSDKWSKDEEIAILDRQIQSYHDILDIYLHLKLRDNRPDSIDVYPLPEKYHLDENGNLTDEMFGKRTIPDETYGELYVMNPLTEEAKEIFDKSWKLDEKYEEDDTELAVRILKIRRFLWS